MRKVYNMKQPFEYSTEGGLKVSQTFGETPLHPVWKTRKHYIPAGEKIAFDIEVTTEIKLEEGCYNVLNFENVHPDDYIEFSIIDKNNISGMFDMFGLVVGEDILELHKFVEDEYFAGSYGEFKVTAARAFSVTPGLYLRILVDSHGETDLNILTRLLWDE